MLAASPVPDTMGFTDSNAVSNVFTLKMFPSFEIFSAVRVATFPRPSIFCFCDSATSE